MESSLKLLLLAGVILVSWGTVADAQCPADGRHLVCYYASWSTYRVGQGRFTVDNIDPSLCTHLVYSFTGLSADGEIIALDPYLDNENMHRTVALKAQNSCLKVLVAIGGWNEESARYSEMVSTPERRERFANSVDRFLDEFGFDGLDFDWEYPTQRGGVPADRENFTHLIRLLRERLNPRGRIITVAIGVGYYLLNDAYEFPALCEASDNIHMMTYDMHLTDRTSTQSPIQREWEEPEWREVVEGAISHLTEVGCDSRKLIMGYASYGRTYQLQNWWQADIGAPVHGQGDAGEYTQEKGILSYYEVCDRIRWDEWIHVHFPSNMGKAAVRDDLWIGYDDADTVSDRVRYAIGKNLGGVMTWTIDLDDFAGICGRGTFPLLRAARSTLG